MDNYNYRLLIRNLRKKNNEKLSLQKVDNIKPPTKTSKTIKLRDQIQPGNGKNK